MTNPTPRPALRKAPDADTHPALADPTSAQVITLPTHADLRASARPSLRRSPDVEPELTPVPIIDLTQPKRPDIVDSKPPKAKKPKQDNKAKKPKNSKADKKSKSKPKSKKSRDKARIDLRTNVSRDVRRKARTGDKARGTSVGDAVDTVMSGLKKK